LKIHIHLPEKILAVPTLARGLRSKLIPLLDINEIPCQKTCDEPYISHYKQID
jgi:hypothetical protein